MSLVALAGATKPCPCGCHPAGRKACFSPAVPCCKDWAGRVYVFGDEVRVPCRHDSFTHDHCEFCGKLPWEESWTPNPDGWAWWRAIVAVLPFGHAANFVDAWWDQWRGLCDPEAAFFAALEQAVVAQGWQLGAEE